MATLQLETGMPPMVVIPGITIRLEAVDPSTGAAVGGVTVSNVAIYGRELQGTVEHWDELPVWLLPGQV